MKFGKFDYRENYLETSIQQTPGYNGHFLQEPQVSAIDNFDFPIFTLYRIIPTQLKTIHRTGRLK